ncbi:MAG: ethanolamine ammonia-lyase subunit EutC [Synergistaceae bacterium]|jgi:ethanolamine ammonia-lyase small subunit|nr:ethanolamine ammonia-lyase subunit EutC [Synergistaceae bacterium]
MIAEADVKKVIEQVLIELGQHESGAAGGAAPSGGCLPDITEVDLRSQILVPNPVNREVLASMKKATPARLGVWRAGPRYKTETLLRFRADHAAAMDAVFSEMPEDGLIKRMNLKVIQTLCTDKDNYLTRPDLGRKFSDEAKAEIKNIAGGGPKVLIYISDGLSTTAVETCAEDAYRAIIQGLDRNGIEVAAPFFVKYGRVPAQDAVGDVTGADVVVTLIGERPGLVTAESMSSYMAYKPTVGMPEARRTVVSNIHKGGTPPVEAGAYIADIIKLMLENRASGLDLKL